MTDKPLLGRDVFIALAAVGWADGHLDEDEGKAIVQTALKEGLGFEEVAAIEAATKERVEIGQIDISGMAKVDRLFVYAVASWMTRLDHVVTDEETAALARLGEALRVPERPREHADEIAQDIAGLPRGDRPGRMDIRLLREVIADRLQEAQIARAQLKAQEEEEAAEAAAASEEAEPEADDGADESDESDEADESDESEDDKPKTDE